MQVMGAVAREHGFKGKYLPALCDPRTNIEVGCEHLASLYLWARGNMTQTLAAYNGGKGGNSTAPYRNIAYALRVMARINQQPQEA
jgi:soluble lytic murein transglycosylase-like protein